MKKIVLEGITKRFGDVVAVDNLSLEIEPGSFFSIVGPSGCGKTTVLRMLAGLERPDSGRIWIGDRLVFSSDDGIFVPAAKRQIGMVFQSYALWPHMRVFDNVSFGLKMKKLSKVEIEQKTASVLSLMQIPGLENRYPSELSGGQQQRVALARELVVDPPVLFMDEPLSNLDARLRMDMRAELRRLHISTGKTIVYVTHDQLEALSLSTQIAVLCEGRIQQIGAPDTVYFRPRNLFVAEFLGLSPINTFRARVNGGQLCYGNLALPVTLEDLELNTTAGIQDVIVGIRPESLSLSTEPDSRSVQGTVEVVLPAGPSNFVEVILADDEQRRVRFTVQDFTKLALAQGDEINVVFNPGGVLVFDPETSCCLNC
jgi:multiple sugar transport system ATP-binding protein